MGKKLFIFLAIVILIIAGFFLFTKKTSAYENIKEFDGEMKTYKTSECGCCGLYYGYFQREGNSNTKTQNVKDINSIKRKYGVPAALESCHTTIVGNYFVEGHIPLEAVEKLLDEKPDIKGIAMPGMPSGSPGMPGSKRGDFIIYAVNLDGTYNEFMRL